MKIVIDTNVFGSSFLNPSGAPRAIIDLWKSGRITLCLCAEILDEYIDVLGRFRIPPADLKNLLDLFKTRQFMEFVVITGDLHVVSADQADDKFIECGVLSSAKFLVSGDKHLLNIGNYGKVTIVKPAVFIETMKD